MKSIWSIYIYVYNRTFSISLFFHIFFSIRSVRRDVRPRQVRRKAAAHTPFAYTIWKLVTLQIRVRLHPTKLDIPTGWKQYRDSSAETGNWLLGRDRSIRVRFVPCSCSTWKIWMKKRNEGEKKGQVLALSGYREKVYIWSKEPGSLSSNTVAASLWSFLKFLFQNSSYLSREKYSPAFRLKSTLNVERCLKMFVRDCQRRGADESVDLEKICLFHRIE